MNTQIKKFSSFKSLAFAVNADISAPEKWQSFLKEKGHTAETFQYLPDHLKTALKFSFAKRSN